MPEELVKAWRTKAAIRPVSPAKKTMTGRMVGLMPIAPSRPWTGNGVQQSHQR